MLDMFTIGIGPSSSHTVGPMKAAAQAVRELRTRGLLPRVGSVGVTLYGSLAATGIGHGTPDAVIAGLEGLDPQDCDPRAVHGRWSAPAGNPAIELGGTHTVSMAAEDIVLLPRERRPLHTNAVEFTFRDQSGNTLYRDLAYSVGGGFVVRDGAEPRRSHRPVWRTFDTANELLAICAIEQVSIAEIALRNEINCHTDESFDAVDECESRLDAIAAAMRACVAAGASATGVLPGGLKVPRRAAAIADRSFTTSPGAT